jgi:Cu/Ag efflux protein CusF
VTETIALQAKVVSVDQNTRMVVLEGPEGGLVEFRADDRVKNLAQVRKGDMISAVYQQAIAARLIKRGAAKVGTESGEALATATPGEKPAALGARTIEITARVTKVDRAKKEVTLKGPKGRSVTVAVKDPTMMEDVKVGDLVEVRYTEALIVAVESPTS